MSQKIIFPNYITKVKITEGRRPRYFLESDDKLPKKYQIERYFFKKGRLYDSMTNKPVYKNASMVSEPRYASLSYNKIGSRQRITILVKLKEWMREFMPNKITVPQPWMIDCTVYDFAMPLEKDLDNMHIYYKAFLDLLKGMGFTKDDSKRFITQAGGFRFTPVVFASDRQLVFSIKQDLREVVKKSLMFNLEPKEVERNGKRGCRIISGFQNLSGDKIETGSYMFDHPRGETVICNFGKTKIISTAVTSCLKKLFALAVNSNVGYWVDPEFYRIHADKIQRELLDKGIPVRINVK